MSITYPKGLIKNLSQPLQQHIKEKIKERNIISIANHSGSRIPQLSKEITDSIGQHRTDQWKKDQIGDHKENFHILWNTIKQLNGIITPSTPKIIITINGKQAIKSQQKATAFNKQFANTVLHKTTSTNRKIDKNTKTLTLSTNTHYAISSASSNIKSA